MTWHENVPRRHHQEWALLATWKQTARFLLFSLYSLSLFLSLSPPLVCFHLLGQGVLGVEIPSHVQLPVLPAVLDHVLRHRVELILPVTLPTMEGQDGQGGDASTTLRQRGESTTPSLLSLSLSLFLSLNPGVRTARGETDDWGGGNGGPIHDKNVILYQPCYTVGPVT